MIPFFEVLTMVFRQPVLGLKTHLESLKTADDKKHECIELIRRASGGRLEPWKVSIARVFTRAWDM